jgi:hypothetical protein
MVMERQSRVELETSSLATKRSSTELLPHCRFRVGEPAEDRTRDILIKSQTLYHLSYGSARTCYAARESKSGACLVADFGDDGQATEASAGSSSAWSRTCMTSS